MPQSQQPDTVIELVSRVRACTLCDGLPLGPKPLLQINPKAKVLIAGQAPGRKTHEKGIPFDDPSGNRLRSWLGIDREIFYDATKIAILPMGLCFPGTGKSGDLPPRSECEPAWRASLLALMPNIKTTLVIGQYALQWHLGKVMQRNLTETVKSWEDYWPEQLPLPHPSPRNMRWFKQNPWFEKDILPVLRARIQSLLRD